MAPSRPSRSRRAAAFGRLFGAIWLGGGLIFLGAGLLVFYWEYTFARDHAVTTGTVLGKDMLEQTTRRSGSRRRTRGPRYYVDYAFRTPEGQTLEARRQRIDESAWAPLEEGQPVQIAYLPDNPSNNRVAGQRQQLVPIVFTALGSLFAVAGSVVYLKSRASLRNAERLRDRGVRTEAVIREIEDANIKINRRPQARVTYEYRDYQGQAHHGRSPLLPAGEASRWTPGQSISVKYDPENPSRSTWLDEEDTPAPTPHAETQS